ncbi:MAG: endonuclease/exonuclease/phosphatase family protein [Devosia sp.]
MKLTAEVRGMATAGVLVLAGLLALVSVPDSLPGVDLLQSLRFHLAALGIPLALLLLLTRAYWRCLLTVVLLLASVGQGILPVLAGYQARDGVSGETLATIRVLSFNVMSDTEQGRAAADFIIGQAPDIAVIMETPGIEPYLNDIAKVLPYHLGCDNPRTCDLTIFSRTPLANQQMLLMQPYRHERLAIATTVIDGAPLTVVGLHLSKPYFDGASGLELKDARRALQALPGRLVLSGDLNAAAWSDQVARFVDALGLVPPPVHPATWPVKAGPLGVPIDNMFTRGALLIDDIMAPENSYGSNHRALLAQLSLRAEAPLSP